MLELVVPSRADVNDPDVGVPQTVAKPQLPSTEVRTEDARAREIIRMQRDIVKRRRRKLAQLATRLAFFVLLPTLLAGYYYYVIATPMYATKSEFVIQQAQSQSAAARLAACSLAPAWPHHRIRSPCRAICNRWTPCCGWTATSGFASLQPTRIDALQRLDPDATKDKAYKVFKKNVKISYDPTEGIIKMEVIAADPDGQRAFSNLLIDYAEEQVDNLTQRLREDQMKGARESFDESEANMMAAQERVLDTARTAGRA